MNNISSLIRENDPSLSAPLYDTLLTKRVFAFIIDVIAIAILTFFAAIIVFFLGILTLGLGWLLYFILCPLIALAYYAATLGSSSSASLGMRAFGITLRAHDGAPIGPIIAVIHPILFYASISLLTPLILVVGLISERKRLLHDIILGTVMVNRL